MRSHTRPPKTNTLHLSNIYCYLLFPLNDRLELMVMLGMMGPTTNGRQSEFSLVLLFSFLLHPHPHPYSSSPNARNDFSQRPFTNQASQASQAPPVQPIQPVQPVQPASPQMGRREVY